MTIPLPIASRAVTDSDLLSDRPPERVRLRVVALVSAVLPAVGPVPPQLRKIAGFAPARRARLGAATIWASLQDADFRRRAAIHVAVVPAAADDLIEAAARAWLERGEGWEALIDQVEHHVQAADEDPDEAQAEVERLQAVVASLQVALATDRVEHEDQLAKVRADYSVLRRRLGEARAAIRDAEASRDQAWVERDEAVVAAETISRSAEADLRKVTAQLDEATSVLAATRRGTRTARDTATMRASYLLETVIDAATGLRRELGLRPIEGAPGDALESALADSDNTAPPLTPVTSAALEQLLSMPRSRVLIDGYNVTKGTWPSASLQAQRSRLVTALGPLVARTGAETTVVFDAGAVATRTAMPAPRGVRVVFSPEGVIADDVIRQLVDAEPTGRVVIVVTDDQELGRDVVRAGARVVPAGSLLALIGS